MRKKKNKLIRKKQRAKNDSATVSNRVAAIIAAKKRRLSGKRRMCQGMCFSLPTLEDPFNDGRKKLDIKTKKTKNNNADQKVKRVAKQKIAPAHDNDLDKKSTSRLEDTNHQLRQSAIAASNQGVSEHLGCPSKFLIMCLNSIETELRNEGVFGNEEGKPLFIDRWGVEFWKCYSEGKDVLEICGSSLTVEQISWIASTAADEITRKEKEGLSLPTPSLLFLVPSQENAVKVRSVCKPLKGLGVHTVSLHAGASIDHQILGLKSCEPEFIVSTPERLLELISVKAIDISGLSFLVVDGLEMLMKCGSFDATKSIMKLISKSQHNTVVVSHNLDDGSHLLEKLLCGKSSIRRLLSDDSVVS